jgi:hypothetical protein
LIQFGQIEPVSSVDAGVFIIMVIELCSASVSAISGLFQLVRAITVEY